MMDPEKGANAAKVILIAGPIALVVFAPWLVDADTTAGLILGLILVFGQLVLIVWLPDQVASLLARQRRQRSNAFEPQGAAVEEVVEPTASLYPWSHARRYDLRSGFTFYLDDIGGKAWGESFGVGPCLAEPSDLKRYFEILTVVLDERRYLGWATGMINELQLLFVKVIFSHHRETDFFREWPVEVIADRLYNYVQEREAREADR